MACPLKNTEENKKIWNELVEDAGGEFQALALFHLNDFEIPSKEEREYINLTAEQTYEVEQLSKFTKLREDIIYSLNNAIQQNKINIGKTEKERKEREESFKRLVDLTVALEDAGIKESIDILLNSGLKTANIMASKSKFKSYSDLVNSSSYLSVFSKLPEIEEFVKILKLDNQDESIRKLRDLSSAIQTFRAKYLSMGKSFLIDTLSNHSTFIRERQRTVYKLEFQKNNPKSSWVGTETEYTERQKEYVNTLMEKNEVQIDRDTKRYVREQLESFPRDIGDIAMWLDDPRNINSPIIQLFAKMLDNADFEVTEKFVQSRLELTNEFNTFVRETGRTSRNPVERYKGLLEVKRGTENELTGYLVGPTYNDVYEDFMKLAFSQQDEVIKEETKERELKVFLDKYIKEDKKELFIENKKDIYKNLGRTKEIGESYLDFLKDEFKNPQWEALKPTHNEEGVSFNTPEGRFWKAIRDFNKASDRMTLGAKSIRYKLPGVTKEQYESMVSQGIIDFAKTKIKDATKLNSNDVERGALETIDGVTKVITDKNGKVLKKVNMPFTGDVDVKDLSFDLMGGALAYRYAALNYKEKRNIQPMAETLVDILGEADYKKTKGSNFLKATYRSISRIVAGVDAEEEKDITDKGFNSNSYKLLQSIIEDRIYGKGTVDAGEILGIDGNKIANGIMKMTGNIFLVANYAGATTNLLQGKVMNFLEGVRGDHFTRNNLRAAEKLYWGDLKNIIADYGENTFKSKTDLLREKFFTSNSGIDRITDGYMRNTKFQKILKSSTLQGLNLSVEHYIQSTLMYAILDNIEVRGKKLHELYEVKDGVLIGPTNIEVVDGQIVENKLIDEKELSRRIKGIVADLHGNYDPNNQAMIQRYWWGKLAFLLRKWIVRTVKRRYVGYSNVNKNLFDTIKNNPHLVHYSEETQSFQEGTHISAIRFMKHNIGNILTLKQSIVAQNWSELTDLERNNIRSVVLEMGVMVMALVAANLLAGLAEDEDDDERLYFLAFSMRRLYGDLMFYTPFDTMEAMRVLRTPTTSMNLLESMYRIGAQLVEDPTEEFQSGRRKGNNKLKHQILKTFSPIYRQLDRNFKESYEIQKEGFFR